MDINKFIHIMEIIGFDLVKYYADVYHRQETGLSSLSNIVNNEKMALTYSGCWYGGLFFKWLFPQSSVPTQSIHSWKITHGYISSDQECHYFLIITTNNKAIILNTYGGITQMLINILSLNKLHELFERIIENDVSAIEPLFGFTPDYDEMTIEDLELKESAFIIPTKEELYIKIDELIMNAYTTEDKRELVRIKNLV
jgi:hypothetical protein